jgi:hypothetical protein
MELEKDITVPGPVVLTQPDYITKGGVKFPVKKKKSP